MAQRPKLDLFDVLLGFFIAVTVQPVIRIARIVLGAIFSDRTPRPPDGGRC